MFYRRLGFWLALFSGIRVLGKSNDTWKSIADEIKKKTNDCIGKRHTTLYDPKNYFFLSMESFRKAIELHTGGNTYKSINKGLFYLEDDLGDMHSHFSAAIERINVLSGKLQDQIDDLRKLELFSVNHLPQGFSPLFDPDLLSKE